MSIAHVLPSREARTEIPRALRRFRTEGAMAEPVVFGSHRKLALTRLPGFERVEHAPQVGGELHGVSISTLRVETLSARLRSSGE